MSSNKHQAMKSELKPCQLGRRLGSGVMIQLPKHQFKYGHQTTLPMNGVNIDTDGKINIELLLPDGDLLFSNKLKWCKPILRPLYQLTIPITHNGETFVPIERIVNVLGYDFDRYELSSGTYLCGYSTEFEIPAIEMDLSLAFNLQYWIIQWLIAHNFHIDEPIGTWISVDELDNNPYEN